MIRFVIEHPKRVLLLGALVTLGVTPGLTRLRLRTDGNALVPVDAPQVEEDRRFRSFWHIDDQTVVVIDTDQPDGIYNRETLGVLLRLTRRLTQIDGLQPLDVTSLATEKSDRVFPGTLDFREMLDPFPRSDADLARLRNDIREYEIYTGTLVSLDGSALAILVSTSREVDRNAFLRSILLAIEDIGPVSDRIYLAGAPVAESQLGHHILEDLLGSTALRAMAWAGMTESAGPSVDDDPTVRVSLVLASMAVMAMVFLVAFRSAIAVVLPLVEVAACLTFTFSLMGWFDVPIYLTIAVIPVILTAIGVADELHIFTRYQRALRDDSKRERLRPLVTTMDEMWRPIIKTSVTSAIGFLSFALSPIAPVRAFGVFMAIGIAFCMVWSLTVVPASLAMIDPKRLTPRPQTASTEPSAIERLVRAMLDRRWWLIGSVAVLLLVSPLGVTRVTIQDSWVDAFSQGSAMHRAMADVNRKFFGGHLLLIELDTGPTNIDGPLAPSDVGEDHVSLDANVVADLRLITHHKLTVSAMVWSDPARRPVRGSGERTLRKLHRSFPIDKVTTKNGKIIVGVDRAECAILNRWKRREVASWSFAIEPTPGRLYDPKMIDEVAALESFIERRRDLAVGGVQGFHEHLAATNFLASARSPSYRTTPRSRKRVQKCLFRYRKLRGSKRLGQVLDPQGRRCTITVFLKDANFQATGTLLAAIREYERQRLRPMGVRLRFAGDVAVSQAMIGGIVRTQTQSLLWSLVGIVTVTSLLSKSFVWGVLSVIPAALAVLMNFAMMGLLQMPLGVATSMFSGMTIGIGVDYAIHLLERLRLSGRGSRDWQAAIVDAMTHAGPAIVVDGVAIALGFGVLLLSPVPANRRLGALVMVAVVTCLVATLAILPALLRLRRPRCFEIDALNVHRNECDPAGPNRRQP